MLHIRASALVFSLSLRIRPAGVHIRKLKLVRHGMILQSNINGISGSYQNLCIHDILISKFLPAAVEHPHRIILIPPPHAVFFQTV